MARRQIGQEHLTIEDDRADRRSSLDEMATLVDWASINRHLDGIYASARGEAGWPPLSLLKAMLLATWHDHL
jgi:IS5 family transposase